METLVNKYYKTYDRVSRYSIFPCYYHRHDNKYLHGITAQLNNTDTPFVAHTVKPGDTLDTLALYYYNNPTYYWVIADFNRIQDPFKDLQIGKVLKVPTFSSIQFDLEGK